eukprot:Rhum_TRINITY_DN11681_c0_g2::Rhum_TRINITY_DN11681_c0_g2_i1::g.46123::m.46123
MGGGCGGGGAGGGDAGADLLPREVVCALVAMGRGRRPRLPDECAAAAATFCRRLKQKEAEEAAASGGGEEDAVVTPPIDLRFVALVVALCQARARLELAEVVSKRHMCDVMELLLELRTLCRRARTSYRPSAVQRRGGGGATKKEALAFMAALTRAGGAQQLFEEEEMRAAAARAGIDDDRFGAALRKLRDEGVVIKTASGKFRLLSA